VIVNVEKEWSTEGASNGTIVVEPPMVLVTGSVSLHAPTAAPLLADAVEADRAARMAQLLEQGARGENAVRGSVAIQLFEQRVESVGERLAENVEAAVKAGGDGVEGRLVRLIHKHEQDLFGMFMRFVDPSSDQAFPAVLRRQLSTVTDTAVAQVKALVSDTEGGPLDKLGKGLTEQIREVERSLLAQIAQKQALAATGVYRGRNFEEAISAKLGSLAASMGSQIDRCGDRPGTRRAKHGDHLITLDLLSTAGQALRIVTEEKARSEGAPRFSFEAVRAACANARSNRDAQAAVFVAESPELLPDGLGFGQVSQCDYFVAWGTGTDDVGLAAALYLARSAALSTLMLNGTGIPDIPAVQRLLEDVRARIDARARVQACHSTAVKAINTATKHVDDDAEAVLVALRKIDRLLLG
jgi:hypothetical protein